MTNELRSLLEEFKGRDWSECPAALPADDFRYVYILVVEHGDTSFPVYVGQTGRLMARVEDYKYKQFGAPTDFRVGEALNYFIEQRRCNVTLYSKASSESKEEERNCIRELFLQGFPLLNFLAAFQYKQTNQDAERVYIHRFCNMALDQAKRSIMEA